METCAWGRVCAWHMFCTVVEELMDHVKWCQHNEVPIGSVVLLQEEDVIGVLPSNDRISQLKPLGDRIMIKVWG